MKPPEQEDQLEVLALASLLGNLFTENDNLKSKLNNCNCENDNSSAFSTAEDVQFQVKAKLAIKVGSSKSITFRAKLNIHNTPKIKALPDHSFINQSQPIKSRSLWSKIRSKIIILCKTCFPRINATKAAWILGLTLFFCLAPQCRSEWHPTLKPRAKIAFI